MPTDWNALSARTAQFRTLQTVYERNGKNVNRVLFAGLHLKLSEVSALLAQSGAVTVTIFADTVVADADAIPARGLVLVARHVDVSSRNGAPLKLGLEGKDSRAEFLAQSIGGGEWKVAGPTGKDEFTVPPAGAPLHSILYRFGAEGATAATLSEQSDLEDLFGRVWALNSMRASFTAAAHLMTKGGAENNSLARAMLRWIVGAIGALGTSATNDATELYGKAAALLVELNIAPGAYYMPVLAADFYKTQVKDLLDALQGYEQNFARLDSKEDLAKVIAQVTTALRGVVGAEAAPLRAHLKNVERGVAMLQRDIQTLSHQVILQEIEAKTAYDVMLATVRSEKILDFVKGVFKVLGSVVKAGVAFTKAEASVGDGLSALLDVVMQGKKALDDINMAMPDSRLLVRSRELLEMQRQLMLAYAAGEILFLQSAGKAPDAKLPEGLAVDAVDPNLAWNNYVIAAETDMTILKEALGSEASSLESVNRYLASVKVLANYGRALDAKFVACSAQMAAVPMVRAQIQAAETAEAQWKELSDKAQTDEERLAILKAALQARMDSIKRAIFAAWRNFRNSYFFLYFREPSSSIDLDMDSARMREVFATLNADIASIYVDPDSGGNVPLPTDGATLEFSFPIIANGTAYPSQGAAALFTPGAGETPPMLTWTFEHGEQFRYKIPGAASAAIWVKQAEFFLDGVQPNPEGNAMMEVATSGTYQNGYGPARSYSFVSRGLSGAYAYAVADGTVYTPWKIEQQIFATPTPFTQWQILFDADGGDVSAVTMLRVRLTVAYRRAPK